MFVLTILTAGVFSVIVIQTRAHWTCVAALLIMRVYALYCRNKWVLSVVLLEVIAAIFLACVSSTLEGSDTFMSISVVESRPWNSAWKFRRGSSTVTVSNPLPLAYQDSASRLNIDIISPHCKQAYVP